MREYLLVLVIAVAVTYLASGLCRRLALRTGALARVRDRDVHTIEMPYFGGVAMFAGVAAAMLLSGSCRSSAASRRCSRTRGPCWSPPR